MSMKKKKRDQCYVFSTKKFKSKSKVRSWLKRKSIKIPKLAKIKKFDSDGEFRIKVRPFCRFNSKSVRQCKIDTGVWLVKGFLK